MKPKFKIQTERGGEFRNTSRLVIEMENGTRLTLSSSVEGELVVNKIWGTGNNDDVIWTRSYSGNEIMIK